MKESTKGNVNIPESFYYEGITYKVTAIGDNAFSGSIRDGESNVDTISIPSTVVRISNSAFEDCGTSKYFKVNPLNKNFTSLDGALYSKDFTTLIKVPTVKKTFKIHEATTRIENYAFSRCNIKSIYIPKTINYIGREAFSRSELESFILPSCSDMSSYILYECNNLKDVWFLGWEGFYQNTIDYGWLSGLPTTTTIHAFPETIHEIKSYYDYQRYNWKCDTIELVEIKDSTLAKLSFRIKDPLIDGKKFVLDNIIMNGRLFSYNQNITHDGTGLYTIDLVPNEIVKATINFTLDGDEYSCTLGLRSKYAEILSQLISYKQTQMECTVTADEDQTASADEVGIYLNSYYPADKSGKVHITGLTPGKIYYYAPYAKYKGYYVEGTSTKITTNGTNPELTCVPGVTSIICTGNKTIDDATLKEQWVECNGEKLSGQDIILTGLEPEQKYTVTYTVTTEEGSTEKVEKTVKTTALELTMLNPQPVSSTCAIVAAETNISDAETNVGFQWRKYEAPETLPSSEGYAAIYDGRIEGYIKRLQSASFYNARAFYKSNSGTYYYSDWVTFDPSDFSYFEPTVHTYAVETVTESTASVRGYVLAGTDEITQQGFEYWPEGGTESAAKQMAVAIADNAADDGVSVVFGTGQVMTATLDGLSPATTYRIRAFVTTAQGTTYGEEQTFTTAKPTGIAAAEEQAEAPAIVGYYDLSGRPLESPQKGITIVRYSDGTCKKIFKR